MYTILILLLTNTYQAHTLDKLIILIIPNTYHFNLLFLNMINFNILKI